MEIELALMGWNGNRTSSEDGMGIELAVMGWNEMEWVLGPVEWNSELTHGMGCGAYLVEFVFILECSICIRQCDIYNWEQKNCFVLFLLFLCFSDMDVEMRKRKKVSVDNLHTGRFLKTLDTNYHHSCSPSLLSSFPLPPSIYLLPSSPSAQDEEAV